MLFRGVRAKEWVMCMKTVLTGPQLPEASFPRVDDVATHAQVSRIDGSRNAFYSLIKGAICGCHRVCNRHGCGDPGRDINIVFSGGNVLSGFSAVFVVVARASLIVAVSCIAAPG